MSDNPIDYGFDAPTSDQALPPQPDPQMDARQAGHSWSAIDDYTTQSSATALANGHTPDAIRTYLGYNSAAPMEEQAQATWAHTLANQDVPLFGDQPPDLTMNPDWRDTYANAVGQRHVLNPQDFSDRYAASLANAAGAADMDPKSRADFVQQLSTSADNLAQSLPSEKDFTDSALSLNPDNAALAKQNLIDHWQDTGTHPTDAVVQAQSDPDLQQQLLTAGGESYMPPMAPEQLAKVADWMARGGLAKAMGFTGPSALESMAQADEQMLAAANRSGHFFIPNHIDLDNPALWIMGTGNIGEQLAAGVPEDALKVDKVDLGNPDQPVTRVPLSEAYAPTQVPTAKLGAPTIETTAAGGEIHRHPIVDENGGEIGHIYATPDPDKSGTVHVDMVRAHEGAGGEIAAGGTPNSLGPRSVRALARQYFDENPSVDTLEGLRITGARGVQRSSTMTITRDQIGPKIDPEASPHEQLSELASQTDTLPEGGVKGMYDKAVEDGTIAANPETEALAEGHDVARSFGSWLRDSFTGLMKDESGTVNLPTSNAERAENRNYIRDLAVKSMGGLNQEKAYWGDRFEKLQLELKPYQKKWERAIKAGPAGMPGDTVIGKWLNYIESRSAGTTFDASNRLTPWADEVRGAMQAMDKRLRQQAAAGILHYDGYVHDYFSHMFTDPASVERSMGVNSGRLGYSGNLMERTGPPTITEALEQGAVLRHTDPFKILMHDIYNKLSYSYAADLFDQAIKDGMMQWDKPEIGAPVGTSFGEKLYVAEGKPARHILYAHPELVKNLNYWRNQVNYSDTTAGFLETANLLKNVFTGYKLAGPMFHSIVMVGGNIASSISLGLQEVARGQVIRAVGDVLGFPLANITNPIIGRRAFLKYVHMTGDPVIQAMTDANFNFGGQNAIENFSGRAPSIYHSIMSGRTLGEWVSHPTQYLGMLPRELRQDVGNIFKDARNPQLPMTVRKLPGNLLRFAATEAGRTLSLINAPFFNGFVRYSRAGAAYRLLNSYMKAYPDILKEDPTALAKYSRQVTQDVDNRMGELQLDNLFWPRMAKVLANILPVSESWLYGTYRGIASGLGYNLERGWEFNGPSTAGLLGTASAFVIINGVMEKLNTGNYPADWHEWLNFKTGGIGSGLAKGVAELGMIPSEAKEIYDWGTIIAKSWQVPSKSPAYMVDYALGKLGMPWSAARPFLSDMVEDPIGHHIPEMPGGWKRYFQQQLGSPIFMEQLRQRQKGTGLTPLESLFGFREAPKWAEDWSAYQKWMAGDETKIKTQEMGRARYEKGQLINTPWYLQNLPAKENARTKSNREFQQMQYEKTGRLPTGEVPTGRAFNQQRREQTYEKRVMEQRDKEYQNSGRLQQGDIPPEPEPRRTYRRRRR